MMQPTYPSAVQLFAGEARCGVPRVLAPLSTRPGANVTLSREQSGASTRRTPKRCARNGLAILAVSWAAAAVAPVYAGREIDPNAPTFRARVAPPAWEFAASPASPAASGAISGLPPADELPLLAQVGTPQEAIAEGSDERAAAPAPSASDSLALNLIKRLVQRGVLPKEDADELVHEAERETANARQRAAVQQQATIEAAVAQAVAAVQAGGGGANPDAALYAAAAAESEGSVRVTYIPETVKAQLRDELRSEVMAQAKEERWAAPRTLPEWAMRMRFFGDVRVRGEGVFFADGNDNGGAFPDFNRINTGAPFDVSGTVFSPQLNVDQDRQRIRLRARLGVEADLGGGFSAGLRIGTGENNSPVSTNQSLGLANQGQGGNFSKYSIWLDRGFLKWEGGSGPNRLLAVSLGRFDNPFFATDLIWDDDVGFDGAAFTARYEVAKGFTPFLTGGAFAVFNTDFNFATNQASKFDSTDKWLYGGQLGFDWRAHKDLNVKLAASYYHFDGVEGRLSDPFVPLSASDQGNTDNTRPSFAQKGNTYRALRNIPASPLNNFGTTNQFQYFGLATPFHELAITGRLDWNRWEPFQISLWGEWVKNLAFDGDAIDRIAVNNRGADTALGNAGRFAGGDTAWIVNLRAGAATLQKRWDWQLGVNYRYVESDAVVDGFTDSDFGLGGTNLQGYSLYGALALGPRVALGLRWMSADEVAGPPLSADILQVDVSGKF